MTGGIDFEAEGLLGGLSGEAREARLALLQELAEAGVPLDELKRAVEEDRLVLLPVERVFEEGEERYTSAQIAEGFSFAGKHRFKGISGETPVHRVRRLE